VQVADGDRVDVLFDKKIHDSQIRMEYINDIIQLSISDASVYPAKISTVSGKNLKKIFVYQYSPRLVRVRLTVPGRAETYQGKVNLSTLGRRLKVEFESRDLAQKGDAPAGKVEVVTSANPIPLSKMTEEQPQAIEPREKPSEPVTVKPEAPVAEVSKRYGAKDSVSLSRVLMSLIAVSVLFLFAARFTKKVILKSGGGNSLSRWVQKSLGSSEKAIEIIATHHLGPNKTIYMIKVTNRTLVIGVSNESISLITELNSNPEAAPIKLDDTTVAQDESFLSSFGEHLVKKMPSASPTVPPFTAKVARVLDGTPAPAEAVIQPINKNRLEGVG